MRMDFDILRHQILIALSIILALSGCCNVKADNKKGIVAYVNREPIFEHEIKRAIALRAKYDPNFKLTPDAERDELDVIIDRKLIVQSAMEKGLAREESFVNAIRTFWEQVLIRDFVNHKKKELEDYLFAADEDVKRYYENMSYKATFRFLKHKDKRKIEEAYKSYLKDKESLAWQAVGPARYEEVSSGVLLDAFEMAKGQAKIFEDASNFYLVEVAEKEAVEIGPLESLKPDIEKRVAALKERRLFEDWLKDKRRGAKIKMLKQF